MHQEQPVDLAVRTLEHHLHRADQVLHVRLIAQPCVFARTGFGRRRKNAVPLPPMRHIDIFAPLACHSRIAVSAPLKMLMFNEPAMARGAGHVPYKGLDGAVRQMGMTVMAHNGAVLGRIRQQRLSKRGQKFRRLLGLNRYKFNEINVPKI